MSAPTVPAVDARTRILDAALRLMGDQGSAGASMRQLAAASRVNVATIYHYFPSKADVLRSVVEERRYSERLDAETPPLSTDAPPRERLIELLDWFWRRTLEEESVWRLLVGESIRGEAAATSTTAEVVGALTATLEGWLADWFPELTSPPAAVARVVQGQIFALVVEHLALAPVPPAEARARGEELAAIVFP
ncbi:MAG TPA: TetR/AcrR family transcriptional regulator [Acidimicrobiales bacterium]